MRYGFVGSVAGMTSAQLARVRAIFCDSNTRCDELHHTDSLGADAEAHDIADELGAMIIAHPSTDSTRRSLCMADVEMRPTSIVDARKRVIESCDVLVVASGNEQAVANAGPWMAANLAKRMGRDVIVIMPDGSTQR